MIKSKRAFTLVELIVVVTIIAVLWTIGFVSYSWFLEWVRDVNRITNLQSIYDWLKMYNTKGKAPKPEGYITIQSSWSTIAYQGNIWKSILEKIDINKAMVDPMDSTAYSYYVTKNRKYIQTMWFLEETDNIDTIEGSFSWIVTDLWRYPKVVWDKLWVLTDTWGVAIQDITSIKASWNLDILTTTESFYSYFRDKEYVIWTWAVLNKLDDVAKVWWKRCSVVNNGINCIIEEYLFTENLLWYWDFENWFVDQSDNQNDGIWFRWVGTWSSVPNSWRGVYAEFDRSSEHFIRVPDDSAYHVNNSTISLWFKQKTSDILNDYWLFSKDHVGQDDWWHFTIKLSEWLVRTRIQEKDPSPHTFDSSHTSTGAVLSDIWIDITDWTHVVVVFWTLDGFNTYVNWELYANNPFQGWINPDPDSWQDIIIWASSIEYEDGDDSKIRAYFDWEIDSVMFFNRALYPDEVQKLYNSQK